ncbi:MAG: histidine kinase [Bacteroidia bacterium]|nr:histidine kinase [Bacteroidia bacterium]
MRVWGLKTLFFSLLGLLHGGVFSQPHRLDSLLKSLEGVMDEQQEIMLLNQIADTYLNIQDINQSRQYAEKAYRLADKQEYVPGKADALLIISHQLFFSDSLDAALEKVCLAKELSEAANYLLGTSKAYMEQGNLLLLKNDNSGSRESFRNAYRLLEMNPDKTLLIPTLGGISDTYMKEGRAEEALDTLLLAYRIAENTTDTFLLARLAYSITGIYLNLPENSGKGVLLGRKGVEFSKRSGNFLLQCLSASNLGKIYVRLNNPDSAFFYLKMALDLEGKLPDPSWLVTAWETMADLEISKENYPEATYWLLKALEQEPPDEAGNYSDKGIYILSNLGNLYLKMQAFNAADQYLKLALQSYKAQNPRLGMSIYEGLTHLAEQSGNTADALHYYKLFISARDSVYNEENTRRMARIELTHEFESRRATEQARQQRELAIRDAKTRQQWLIFVFVILGIIGVGGLGFYSYRLRQGRYRTELELASLRAQMNPHFIFNCLNSIYRYTREGDTDTAGKYLQKFSRLLRLVLENSRLEKITLARDLEALKLYVDIESLRFKEKLMVIFDISPDIDQGFVKIPGMLIQPYVENAIWHGLMHRDAGGKIIISIQQPAEHRLVIEVVDDGVGRIAAAEIEGKNTRNYTSLGSQITEERMKIARQLNHNMQLHITDLADTMGNATGTKVVIEIPV